MRINPLLHALQTGIPLQGIIALHIPLVCFLSSSAFFLLTHELCRRGGGGVLAEFAFCLA